MRDGQLVTQPRFSRRILRVSFLSLLSVASAAYNRCHGCALCALLGNELSEVLPELLPAGVRAP